MASFLLVKDFGFLRTILECCRDNERVFLSHTCSSIREVVSPWIPTKHVYRTLTRPKILPELFDEKDGVFSIGLPETKCEHYFNMTMLKHADIHKKGIQAFKWFQVVTGARPSWALVSMFAMRFMWDEDDNESLNARQMLVLRKRFEGNRDNCLLLHDKRHWDLARGPLMKNTSIKRIVLYSAKTDVGVNCYDHIFRALSRRNCPTEYLDLSGRLSNNTVGSFPLVAFDLTGIMLRRVENPVVVNLLNIILSRPNDAKLVWLQLEQTKLDVVVQEVVLNVLDILPISKLLFSNCRFPPMGLLKVISLLGSSMELERLFIRRCKLSVSETVGSLMLPTMKDSSIVELSLTGIEIAEEAAEALELCVGGCVFLHTLSLDECDLGPRCMTSVVRGLKKSTLSSLSLKNNNIGELAHALFYNVGEAGSMRNLFLDGCTLCSRSAAELQSLTKTYRRRGTTLYVSMIKFKKIIGC